MKIWGNKNGPTKDVVYGCKYDLSGLFLFGSCGLLLVVCGGGGCLLFVCGSCVILQLCFLFAFCVFAFCVFTFFAFLCFFPSQRFQYGLERFQYVFLLLWKHLVENPERF